jgi:hypothetical protein
MRGELPNAWNKLPCLLVILCAAEGNIERHQCLS